MLFLKEITLFGLNNAVTGQNPPDNKSPRIIEEIIVKYAIDVNLFRLGSTNPKKYPFF